MAIENKRVTQLIEMTAQEVEPDDLFLIIDSTAKESKKIQTSEFSAWLNSSGSLYAIHAINSDTSSFILGQNVFGSVSSSSFSNNALSSISSSWSSASISASYSQTASYALNANFTSSTTSSYLKYSGFPNGTSSYSLKSNLSDNSNLAFNLFYNGQPNGTASYSITTQNVNHAINSDTASYLNNTIGTVSSASWANNSGNSLTSNSSSYLIFTPGISNGTASYALVSSRVNKFIQNYGVFNAITQSLSISQLDDVFINPSDLTFSTTSIEAVGTVIVPFTSSILVNEFLNLVIKDRNSGIETIIDSTPVYYFLSPTVGSWGSYNSGSIKIPYTMLGESSLLGHYMVFVTASSNNISIEPSRVNKFNISSISDTVTVNSGLPLEFFVIPSSTPVTFSSNVGGPFFDIAYNIVHVSGSNNIFSINLNNSSISQMGYIWTLSSLQTASFSTNSLIQDVGGFPSSLKYLDCSNCSLTTLSDLSFTTTSYLKCDVNNLTELPVLPSTMSYINCSNNPITNLPAILPSELLYFYCDGTQVGFLTNFPNTIISMSLANNINLNINSAVLPSDLVYFNTNNSPVGSLPALPSNLKFIHCFSSSLSSLAMDNICSQSYVNATNNAVYTGSIDITGNGPPTISTINNYIVPLIGTYSWSIMND